MSGNFISIKDAIDLSKSADDDVQPDSVDELHDIIAIPMFLSESKNGHDIAMSKTRCDSCLFFEFLLPFRDD